MVQCGQFSPKAAARLETLHPQWQRDGSSGDEDAERMRLAGWYERAMLMRAQSAELLAERDHEVTSLVVRPGAFPEHAALAPATRREFSPPPAALAHALARL